MKIVATTAKIFAKSKTKVPGKVSQFVARVTAKELNVRDWAGAEHKKTSFSPLKMGDTVLVCDAILSADHKTWYYINHKGKYGFINSEYVESVPTKALKFVGYLDNYNTYVRANGRWFEYGFDPAIKSFQDAKNLVSKKKKVHMTCLVPTAWALNAMGIKRKDGVARVSADNGSFTKQYNGGIKDNFTRITSGKAIGKKVPDAIEAGLLRTGDILAFEDTDHTISYSGDGYYMFDGGHMSIKNGVYVGIKSSYKSYGRKISEILRWKG